jgi:hypothetical protein
MDKVELRVFKERRDSGEPFPKKQEKPSAAKTDAAQKLSNLPKN